MKILQRSRSDSPAVAGGVHVDDVGADCDMHGHGHPAANTGGQKAVAVVWKRSPVEQPTADRFTNAHAALRPISDRPVDDRGRLFGHAETAVVNPRLHFFGGLPDHGQLNIVNNAGAIERDAVDDPAFHQIDQDRIESDLDHVCPHPDQHQAALAVCRGDGINDLAQIISRQDGG